MNYRILTNLLYSVWVNVVPPDGVPRRVSGYSGESLLDVLNRNYTAGIFPDC